MYWSQKKICRKKGKRPLRAPEVIRTQNEGAAGDFQKWSDEYWSQKFWKTQAHTEKGRRGGK